MAEKLYPVLDQNMGHFIDEIKKTGQCVSYIIQKEKSWIRPQRIVHVVYVKRKYKTLDFCELPVRTYFILSVEKYK